MISVIAFGRANIKENKKIDPLGLIIPEITSAVVSGGRIVINGLGREGLMMKGLAMRLFHLGLNINCMGEMMTPSIRSRDLQIVSTGLGGFDTIDAICQCAGESGHPLGSTSQFAHDVTLVLT
eukprot:Gb_10847 [translate_table: standard]